MCGDLEHYLLREYLGMRFSSLACLVALACENQILFRCGVQTCSKTVQVTVLVFHSYLCGQLVSLMLGAISEAFQEAKRFIVM